MIKNNNDKLIDIFKIIFNDYSNNINKNISMQSYAPWDSLKNLNLILSIEEEFNIQLTNDEILTINNFQSIISILNMHGIK